MKIGDFVRCSFTDRPDLVGVVEHIPVDTGDMFHIKELRAEKLKPAREVEMLVNPNSSALITIEVLDE